VSSGGSGEFGGGVAEGLVRIIPSGRWMVNVFQRWHLLPMLLRLVALASRPSLNESSIAPKELLELRMSSATPSLCC
jgi:hypothetical protein